MTGNELRTLRLRAGLKTEEAAERIGVSVGTFSRAERTLDHPVMGKVARCLVEHPEWCLISGARSATVQSALPMDLDSGPEMARIIFALNLIARELRSIRELLTPQVAELTTTVEQVGDDAS